MDKTTNILKERQKTYGDFKTTADVAQKIKEIIRKNNDFLNSVQNEALEMIATKIARILTGNPSYDDNWKDIAGYAHLGGELFNSNKS